MVGLSHAFALLSLLGGTLLASVVGTAARAATNPSMRSLNPKRLEAGKRWGYSARGRDGAGDRRATDTSPPSKVKNITFTNPKASGAYSSARLSLCLMHF